MLRYIRQRLGVKLFISYIIVILVGIIALGLFTEFTIPAAFEHHMQAMMDAINNPVRPNSDTAIGLEADLYNSFRNAVNEALTRALVAVLITAIAISLFVSRQVVEPVRAMMDASLNIAEGNYKQRVPIPGNPNDMDELGELARRFNRMAEKLDQTESLRRQMLADVSHELRTPLTVVNGALEGIIDGVLPLTPETFAEIQKEVQRLQNLVADLQELSRAEAGAYALHRVPVSLSDLVNDVVRRLHPQFEQKGILLTTTPDEHLPPVQVDRDRILQVLINLVGNALQYTPSGGQVHIQYTLNADDTLQVAIRDNGIGIPAEHLPHVFDRFYRVDKSRSRAGGGSGIGLTISKRIIEAHGGRIWVKSDGQNKGSTFYFTLPLAYTSQNAE